MFKNRSYSKELIDDFELSGEELAQNLRELHVINNLLGGYAIDKSGIRRALKSPLLDQKNELEILDVGCGGGDTLKVLSSYLKKIGVSSKLTGLDANDFIIEYAKGNCQDFENISFIKADALKPMDSNLNPDIVVFSLFFHHFNENEIKTILENVLNSGAKVIIINDLHRHFLAYYSIRLLTILFSKSRLVKNDAPLSVLRGFKRREWKNILEKFEGIHHSIAWEWAFRWKVMIFEKRQNNG